MGIFTLEYLARIATCRRLGSFMASFSNTVDLVAIAPFYLELAITGHSAGGVGRGGRHARRCGRGAGS